MMKVMNERTLNSASSMKNPLSAPARGIAFQRAILRRCGVPMYGANLLYPLSVPVYSPPSVRRGRPSRRGYPKGRRTKRQPHPEKKGVRLPSGLCRRQDRRRAIPANRQPRRSLRKGWGGRGWFRRDRGLCSHAGWRGWFRRSDRKRGLRRCALRGACRCLLQRRA